MNKRLLIFLAFAAGWLDTATFVGAHGLFAAHVTGNFVLFAAKLVTQKTDIDYLKLISFLFFILSNYFSVYFFHRILRQKASAPRTLLIIESLLIVLCGIGFAIDSHSGDSLELISFNSLLLMTLVFALGIQNAVPKLNGAKGPPTTVMTGNVTQMTVDLGKLFLKRSLGDPELKDSLVKTFSVIFSFAVGCILAAYSTSAWGLPTIIIPGLMLLGILITSAVPEKVT